MFEKNSNTLDKHLIKKLKSLGAKPSKINLNFSEKKKPIIDRKILAIFQLRL